MRRARASAEKRDCFSKRPKMWIQRFDMQSLHSVSARQCRRACRETVEKVRQWCLLHEQPTRFAELFLLCYAFLLRLPSEALPVTIGPNSGKASLFNENGELVLVLARRCNRCLPLLATIMSRVWQEEQAARQPSHPWVLVRCIAGMWLLFWVSRGSVCRSCASGFLPSTHSRESG